MIFFFVLDEIVIH